MLRQDPFDFLFFFNESMYFEKKICIYMKGRERERKNEKDIFHLLMHFPNSYRAQQLYLFLTGQRPSYFGHYVLLTRVHISKKLELGAKFRLESRHSNVTCGHPKQSLKCQPIVHSNQCALTREIWKVPRQQQVGLSLKMWNLRHGFDWILASYSIRGENSRTEFSQKLFCICNKEEWNFKVFLYVIAWPWYVYHR